MKRMIIITSNVNNDALADKENKEHLCFSLYPVSHSVYFTSVSQPTASVPNFSHSDDRQRETQIELLVNKRSGKIDLLITQKF